MTYETSIHDNSGEEKNVLLAAALAYVAAGRSVAPIAPNQKYPQGNSWKVFQTRLATPDEITSWFRRAPLLGLCIMGLLPRPCEILLEEEICESTKP